MRRCRRYLLAQVENKGEREEISRESPYKWIQRDCDSVSPQSPDFYKTSLYTVSCPPLHDITKMCNTFESIYSERPCARRIEKREEKT